MKKNILGLLTLVTFAMVIFGFKNKAEELATKEIQIVNSNPFSKNYKVNVETSSIEWQGFKPTGSHKGTIKLKSGIFTAKGNNIRSGSFIIDMRSIKESKDNAKLEGHLKSDAFFDIEQFPIARFEITSLEKKEGNSILSGNLTLKGVTHPVSFPVTVTHQDTVLTFSSDVFTIDRSKWNVRYGSKSFFDNLKDKFINDDIELKVTVKAKKS